MTDATRSDLRSASRPAEAPTPRASRGSTRPARVDWLVVLLVVGVAAALRAPALAPPSLWLDDAWAALVIRAHGWSDLRLVAVTAPGWTVGLAGWLGAVGLSSLAAQAPAFAAGVLGPGALYLVAVRGGRSRAAAAFAAAILLASPIHLITSTRVKPYTIDALLAIAIVAVAWPLLDDPARPRRWAVLAGVGIVATVVSAPAAVTMAAAVAAAGLAALRDRAGWRSAVTAGGGYLLVGLVWWRFVLAPAVTDGLRDYWAAQMLPTGGVSPFLRALGAALVRVAETLSWTPPWLTLTVGALALLLLAVRRPLQAVLFGGPLLVGIVLAALGRSPIGGMRTDTYLLPTLALLIAGGVDVLSAPASRRAGTAGRRAAATVMGLAALALAVGAIWHVPAYPEEDVRPLVTMAERGRAPGDAIVVYPSTRWAYALYTDAPVRLVPNPDSANGFEVIVDHRAVRVLGPHRADPEAYLSGLRGMTRGVDRVWFVASHWGGDLDVLEDQFRSLGFHVTREEQRPGARLLVWEREPGR